MISNDIHRFIEKFGTHIIVGVKMGGKDVVYLKQQYSSPLQPSDVQKRLKDVADKRFTDASGESSVNPEKAYGREMVCSVDCCFGLLHFLQIRTLSCHKIFKPESSPHYE